MSDEEEGRKDGRGGMTRLIDCWNDWLPGNSHVGDAAATVLNAIDQHKH